MLVPPSSTDSAVGAAELPAGHFGVRMFGVLRFVIQSFSLLWRSQPVEMKNRRIIEQANFEGKPLDPCSRRRMIQCRQLALLS